eukprot:7386114-Prymnesium_polylepis.1
MKSHFPCCAPYSQTPVSEATDRSCRCRSPGSGGGWHQSNCTAVDYSRYFSALPPGLTEGVDALTTEYLKNWAYKGTAVGSPGELRMAIGRLASWNSSRPSEAQAFVTSFSILPSP